MLDYLLGSPMFAVILARGVCNIHEDVMTLVKVALCQADTDGEGDTPVRFDTGDLKPARSTTAFLMYYIIAGCR